MERGRSTLKYELRAGVALVIVIGIGIGLAVQGKSDGQTAASLDSNPQVVSTKDLQAAARRIGHPIYWAGPMPGKELEASEDSDGAVKVRYIESGIGPDTGTAETGEGWLGQDGTERPKGKVLSVTSTPGSSGISRLHELVRQPSATVRHLPDGRQVVWSSNTPSDVYFSSPTGEIQIKVYDPSPTRALALVLSGRVRSVSGP
jgi:hypothetical protein